PRNYGYAMAYATRAITLYQSEARRQQNQLMNFRSPEDVAANKKFWALNSVGTSYFIIGNAWMLMSYDYKGSENPGNLWQRALLLADYWESGPVTPPVNGQIYPTNAVNCVYFARQVFSELHANYSYAHLRDLDGTYHSFDQAVEARFPEILQPYIPLT